jgi:small Trp-rich protein
MPLVCIGVALLIAKWMEFGPMANVSWWWVFGPLIAAVLWFEMLQPMLGYDRKKDDGKVAAEKKARIARAFQVDKKAHTK